MGRSDRGVHQSLFAKAPGVPLIVRRHRGSSSIDMRDVMHVIAFQFTLRRLGSFAEPAAVHGEIDAVDAGVLQEEEDAVDNLVHRHQSP